MKRDWTSARRKIEAEGRCRFAYAGNCQGPLAAAHTIGRRNDSGVVDPDDVVPLCTYHHALYDGWRLNLLPHLTYIEQAAAVRHVGIDRALQRLTGGEVTMESSQGAAPKGGPHLASPTPGRDGRTRGESA